MAEPLTSTDIIRERMGFGVSPLASGETRRAYAEAGLSPLGTQDRERFEAGGALSPMATRQEQEAWKQAEFMAGRREQAPISYGGIGDRPVGASRRDIRMQAEWDKRRDEEIARQQAMQRMKLEADQYELSVRTENRLFNDQEASRNAQRLKAKLEEQNAAIKNQAFGIMADADLNDPLSYSRVVEQLSDISGALENEDVRSALGIIQKASESSQGSLIRSKQKEINSLVSDARQLGISEKQLATVEEIDDAGNTFINTQKLQTFIDTTKGAQAVKEEKRKESAGEYKPMSVEQAQDELDVAQAEFDAIQESGEEDDDAIAKSKARLRKAEAQLKVSRGRASGGVAPAKKTGDTAGGNGYTIGKSYQGMTYLGGDPNKESSWKKK